MMMEGRKLIMREVMRKGGNKNNEGETDGPLWWC